MAIVSTGAPVSWQARTCYLAAALFTMASGGTNLMYGWAKGTDTGTSLVWAAVSIAVSAVFALSWPALIVSLDRKQWARAVMVLIALLITGTYSVSAALGSASGGRVNAAEEEKSVTDARGKVQAAYDQAQTELQALASVKPGAELQGLIDAARAELAKLAPSRTVGEIEALRALAQRQPQRFGCAAVNGSLALSCPGIDGELSRARQRERLTAKIAGWTEEIGQADQRRTVERTRLKAEMDKASAELASIRPAKVANSDAAALATYLQALGVDITPDRVNKLLVLLAVLIIECGGGLALAVGMALSDQGVRTWRVDRVSVQAERTLTERLTGQADTSPERNLQIPSTANGLGRPGALSERPERSAHERVLDALRSKDGVLFGGQRALGAVFGWSKTRMNEVLHELEAAGRVRLSVSRQGTAVRLAAGSA